MKRKVLTTLLLLLLTGMMFAGCGRDQNGISRVTAPPEVGRPGATPALIDLEELDYEVFSGTLEPGHSGLLNATSTTWGKNCVFSLVVPDTVLPAGLPVNFTLRIPTKDSHIANGLGRWMLIRFDPSQEFEGTITVSGTWMPWEGTPPNPLWVYDRDGTDSTLATVTQMPGTPTRYRVSYQVSHFSDWETGPGPKNEMP